MKKKKMKNEFYCTECGCVQKPKKETDKWETYSTECQECGAIGKISIRLVESENE